MGDMRNQSHYLGSNEYTPNGDISEARYFVEQSLESQKPSNETVDSFHIPPRSAEIGQNAVDSSIDLNAYELTSTVDGSKVEDLVVTADLLLIGSNLEAARINKTTDPAGVGAKVIGITSLSKYRQIKDTQPTAESEAA